MAEDPKVRDGTLARRLDWLFRNIHPPGKREPSYQEVADGIEAAIGQKVTRQYVQQLRMGVADNPSMRILQGLAAFFGVNPAFFFSDEEAERTDDAVAALLELLDAGALNLAARLLPGLPADSLEVIRQVAEHLRELAGLPNAAPGQALTPASADGEGGRHTNP
jgi:ESX-1-secreted protein regulator